MTCFKSHSALDRCRPWGRPPRQAGLVVDDAAPRRLDHNRNVRSRRPVAPARNDRPSSNNTTLREPRRVTLEHLLERGLLRSGRSGGRALAALGTRRSDASAGHPRRVAGRCAVAGVLAWRFAPLPRPLPINDRGSDGPSSRQFVLGSARKPVLRTDRSFFPLLRSVQLLHRLGAA